MNNFYAGEERGSWRQLELAGTRPTAAWESNGLTPQWASTKREVAAAFFDHRISSDQLHIQFQKLHAECGALRRAYPHGICDAKNLWNAHQEAAESWQRERENLLHQLEEART